MGAELDRILADEIGRRLEGLSTARAPLEARAALHSLRGASAMAGHHELAVVLAQLSVRLHRGDGAVLSTARALLTEASARLRGGQPPLATRWPEPPTGMVALREAGEAPDYKESMRARLRALDAALTEPERGEESRFEVAFRVVHGLKSAAAGHDDVTAWFCHGLEERVRGAQREGLAGGEFAGLMGRYRAVLALLIEEPERGLTMLRAFAERRAPERSGALVTGSTESSKSTPPQPLGELRIPARAVDAALERVGSIAEAREDLRVTAELAHRGAARLRELRGRATALPDALKGATQPALVEWVEGVSRELGEIARVVERGGFFLRRSAAQLERDASELSAQLRGLQTTSAGALFQSVTRGVSEQAAEQGKVVRVSVVGEEVQVPRALADQVREALTQLVRNAVAHGVESPVERQARGKPLVGQLELRARRRADRLLLDVADDGCGVDVEALRRTAATLGVDPQQAVRQAPDDDDLLTLLALPGLTTRLSADLWSGRGVGLQLAQQTVLGLGGALTLQSRAAAGLRARLDLPLAGVATELLWVSVGTEQLALPVECVEGVTPGAEQRPLAELLGMRPTCPVSVGVELRVEGIKPVHLGVEGVGALETRIVQPLGLILQRSGPFAGVVRRPDGSLGMVLDASAVIARARAALKADEETE